MSAPTVVYENPNSTVSSVSGAGRGRREGGDCVRSRLTLGSVADESAQRVLNTVTVASWSK